MSINKEKLSKLVAVVGSFYIFSSVFFIQFPIVYRSVIFAIFFSLIFLTNGNNKPSKMSVFEAILILLIWLVPVYFLLNLTEINDRRLFIDVVTMDQIILGIFTIVIIIEGSRRVSGMWLPIINGLSIVYVFFGNYILGRFGHLGFSLAAFIDMMFLSRHGIWGVTLATASNTVIFVLLFSTFLIQAGFDKFIFKFINLFVGNDVASFGKAAVLSSALFGMISGGGASNVSATGTITIPAMIRKGYDPIFAAAIESTASMASTFTPPVLGSVAFLMSELIAVQYRLIVFATIIPALLFYFSLFIAVNIKSKQIKHLDTDVLNREHINKELIEEVLYYLIPLGYFITRIFMGSPISRVSVESILITIFLFGVIKKTIKLSDIPEILQKGIKRSMVIVVMMSASGIFIGVVNLTGFVSKIGVYFSVFYNSNILFSILFIVLIILILGTALNTTTTYLISVVFFAPIFLKQGYDLLPTHLFILYYSALGSITPPVALTSLTAASIANASFMKVSVKAMSLSSVMYFIPVLILINPMILHPVLSVEFGVMLLRILLGMYLLVYATEDNSFNEKYRIIIKGFLFFAGAAIIVLDMNFTLTIVLGLMALSINQFTRKEVFK